MESHILEMVVTAYDETRSDAMGLGRDDATAHAEGMVAAAMCLAALTGMEDAAARAEVEALDLRKLAA